MTIAGMGFDLENAYIQKFLEEISFFDCFSDHEKSKLLGDKSSFKRFGNGQDVFSEGDEGASLYIVLIGNLDFIKLDSEDTGKDRISKKDEIERVVGEVGPGAVFGEISLLTGRKRCATARVTSDTTVLMEITNKIIEGLIPSIQTKIHKQLLLELVDDLDDMDKRYMKQQSSLGDNTPHPDES